MSRSVRRILHHAAWLPTAALLLVPAHASAQVSLDVSQTENDILFTNLYYGHMAMSFTPGANSISGAGIQVDFRYGQSSSTVQFGLWTARPDESGATQLAGGSVLAELEDNEDPYSPRWVDVFWSSVAITPGSQLWLVTHADAPVGVWSTAGDPYAGGYLAYNRNAADPTDGGYYDYGPYDQTFRTWTGGPGGGEVVPEPATLLLLGTGLLGVAGVAWRRRLLQ